jgi:hypothetical protein
VATYDPIKIIRQDMDSRFRQTFFIAQISSINQSFYTADISVAGSTIPGASFLDDVNVEDMEINDLVVCLKVMGKIVILGGLSPKTSARSLHRFFGNIEIGGHLDQLSLPTNAERYSIETSYSYSYDDTAGSYSYVYAETYNDYTISEDEHAGEIRRYDSNLYLYSSSYRFNPYETTDYDFGWKFVKSDDARFLQGVPIRDRQPTDGQWLGFGTDAWVPRTIEIIRPIRATMWHEEATVITGGTLTGAVMADHPYNWVWYQNAPDNGDSFTNGCLLEDGTYSFYVLGRTANTRGKIDWSLDGVVFSSGQDWYSSSSTSNVTKVVTGITVATSGWHILLGTINGKNGSSSDYDMRLTKYWFKKTSDNRMSSKEEL